jgi:hypothetical protein
MFSFEVKVLRSDPVSGSKGRLTALIGGDWHPQLETASVMFITQIHLHTTGFFCAPRWSELNQIERKTEYSLIGLVRRCSLKLIQIIAGLVSLI